MLISNCINNFFMFCYLWMFLFLYMLGIGCVLYYKDFVRLKWISLGIYFLNFEMLKNY